MGLIIAFGLIVVHAHVPAPSDLPRDLAAVTAASPESAGIDRADPATDAASDLELVASEAPSPRPADRPDTGLAAADFSSRSVAPGEPPPRIDPSRA